jgi:hypothetical protein
MIESTQQWHDYFEDNSAPVDFPWHDPSFLSPPERNAIASSVAQFQLGEGSDGAGFLRRGEFHAHRHQDARFVPTLRLFIAEEQRHSAWLGRFLDRERIPRLTTHWVDRAFRHLRKLADLEMCVTVLVTAECIAMPYYRALHDATASPLLRRICARILAEEAAHLEYQADTLLALSRKMPSWRRPLVHALHAALLTGTCAIVWQQHAPVFRAAKYSGLRMWAEAALELSAIEDRIRLGLTDAKTLDAKKSAGPRWSSSSEARRS